ncbi:hypothetical protein [Alphaentomopoxvirus acuprea]|uniref:Uncharacterized protein n=1 Tax=Alphaentomopoxvirus acuprea TaxID=62099 RepID=W6JLH5_9POXV|nr:hypothetical protein BA82_gp106 [Anomala cuprea entomopoxvirus]BAO49466.1 hypothetical protein [Anomala cuprea entomopoxvirus]
MRILIIVSIIGYVIGNDKYYNDIKIQNICNDNRTINLLICYDNNYRYCFIKNNNYIIKKHINGITFDKIYDIQLINNITEYPIFCYSNHVYIIINSNQYIIDKNEIKPFINYNYINLENSNKIILYNDNGFDIIINNNIYNYTLIKNVNIVFHVNKYIHVYILFILFIILVLFVILCYLIIIMKK